MSFYEIVTLVISILSLFASVTISFVIFFMSKKIDNKKYQLDIEHQARKFIIDHGDNEILYLPYCVIASGVNRHHKHIRKIYNNFDALPNDVQKEVLKQTGYGYKLIDDFSWIDEGLEKIKKFTEQYDFGFSLLHDDAKYFSGLFTKYSSALVSKYNEVECLFDDLLEWQQTPFNTPNKIPFSSYIESYYRTFIIGENEKDFKKENVIKPLDYLNRVKNLRNCDEEELCFWIMVIVRELASYVERTRHGGYMNGINIPGIICCGDALPETFEDMYYKTLIALYKLKLDEECFKNNKIKERDFYVQTK